MFKVLSILCIFYGSYIFVKYSNQLKVINKEYMEINCYIFMVYGVLFIIFSTVMFVVFSLHERKHYCFIIVSFCCFYL